MQNEHPLRIFQFHLLSSLSKLLQKYHAWLSAVYTGGSVSMVFNDGIPKEEREGVKYHFRICGFQ